MSKSGSDRVTLVLTPGEPSGIGPDLALTTAAQTFDAQLLVIADPAMLAERAQLLSIDVQLNDYGKTGKLSNDCLNVLPVALNAPCQAGTLDPANSGYVIETLERAVSLCESGEAAGMVTGPVNKAVINDAGIPFSGHTEWLAARTGTPRVVMMLATDGLRVALATTHLPLRDVPDAIDVASLIETTSILHRDLVHKFGLRHPRITVCGLNPHAGESGHLGREEIEIIGPAIEHLRSGGLDVRGPLPADTIFTPSVLEDTDVVLAMYHDQGLPVLKHKGFGAAVNITLGLPIIRTSVDHGTALDLAGSGRAEPHSLFTAIEYATEMATHLHS